MGDRYAYVPKHPLLRNKVTCTPPALFLEPESLNELRVLALCVRSRISRDMLRSIGAFVLRKQPQSSPLELGVVSDHLETVCRVLAPRDMTVNDFCGELRYTRINWRVPLDGNLVHISLQTVPFTTRLLQFGSRANSCIRDPDNVCEGRQVAWSGFEDWKLGPLPAADLQWLNSRTLEEAGVKSGDIIDTRCTSDGPLLQGRLERAIPPEDNGTNIEPLTELLKHRWRKP